MRRITFQGYTFTLYPLDAKRNVPVMAIPGKPLHRFGSGPFCEFSLPQGVDKCKYKRGLYIFVVNGEVRYLGRCLTTYKQRLSEYGRILPSDRCKKNGQPTNCHINSELNAAFNAESYVEIGICPLDFEGVDGDAIIEAAEQIVLDKMRKDNPYWNLRY
ncbi:MAG: hypothetical protein J5632_01135 [Bacteroidales bacterium]|nr:hypothetical protein [Bacteroidales bacterium]